MTDQETELAIKQETERAKEQDRLLLEWFEKLRAIAKERDALFLISDDPLDHADAYDDGMTPQEEFDEQYSEACRSCA